MSVSAPNEFPRTGGTALVKLICPGCGDGVHSVQSISGTFSPLYCYRCHTERNQTDG